MAHPGSDDATLRDPGVRVEHPAIGLQNPGFQPRPDQAPKGPVIDAPGAASPAARHGPCGRKSLGCRPLPHRPYRPYCQVKGQVTDRFPCSASGPVPITDTPATPAHRSRSGCWRRLPEAACLDHRKAQRPLLAVALRNVACRRISFARYRFCFSRSTQCLDMGLQVALHTCATSRHPPHWPRPCSGRPSSPAGARRSGPRKGPESGAACPLSPCRLSPAGRWAGVLPVRRCPAQVSCAGCVLPSRPSPCPWLSHAQSTRREKTPPRHPAGFPCHQYFSACLSSVPRRCSGSGIVPCPGFPFRASRAVDQPATLPPRQEPVGPPKFFDVSLPACRGLWTPADLHILANADALVSPSVRVKTLGVRHKLGSKLYQHFRVRGHPYGLQDALSTLRPSCSPWLTTTPPWTQDSIRVGG